MYHTRGKGILCDTHQKQGIKIHGTNALLGGCLYSEGIFCLGGKSFDPLGSMPIDNESESLRKTLNKTEADLKQMTARANGAEDSVSDLKRRLAALQKQLTSLKADNSSLQNKVASANKRPVTNGSAVSKM